MFLGALVLLSSGPVGAFELALSDEEDPQPLHWEIEDGGPIVVRHHLLGGEGFFSPLLEAASRRAMMTWASESSSSISFSEGPIFSGPPCPHALPAGQSAELVCGGATIDVDGHSALFFIESNWPYGEEVIALTSVSYEAGGRSVDADISFNGEDFSWSLGDDGVRTDYQSIVLHELGHLLGLAHSEQDGAVMSVDYQDGDVVRDLHADDALGLAQIYPCESPPCIGGVTYEASQSGCTGPGNSSSSSSSSSWSLRSAAVPLFFLLALGAGRRSLRVVGGAVVSGLAILLVASPVDSSTTLELGIADLAERAERVVYARVVDSESWKDGIAWTRVRLEVLEDWKGEGPERLELVQPGGFTGDFGTLVFGMPRFEQDEEVALFLVEDEGGQRVLGLSQGKFTVDGAGGISRELHGLALARVGGHRSPTLLKAPKELGELRSQVLESRP